MACTTTTFIGAPIERLGALAATATDGTVKIFWQNSTSYPDQWVAVIYRKEDLSDVFSGEIEESRDLGSIDISGLFPGENYIFWIRPMVSGYYGAWQSLVITATEGEVAGLTPLIHDGDNVVHLGEIVLVSYNPSTEVPNLPEITNGVEFDGDDVEFNGETVTFGD